MRVVIKILAALAAALLVACGSDPAPRTQQSGTPSPSASPALDPAKTDVELVAEAVRATRARKTGSYVTEGVTVLGDVSVTMTREGSYDLTTGRAKVTQTMAASPPEAFAQIAGEGVDPDDLTALSVLTENAGYLRMPAWPAPANAKWLRFTPSDLEKLHGVAPDLDAAIFPASLAMLAEATASGLEASGRAATPPVLHVVVPAGVALAAVPSSSAAKLTSAGADLSTLPGEVEVEVELKDGYVSAVSFDVLEAFKAALVQIGQPNGARGLTELATTTTIDDVGEPVRIVVPAPSQVMTQEEFERTAKR